MVGWHEAPRFKVVVTHATVDYTFDAHFKNIAVTRRENGFDIGTVILEDSKAHNYSSQVAADDIVKIYEQNKGDGATWTTLLIGIIRRAEPMLSNEGNLLKIECDGAGWGLGAMLCADEYGVESTNPTLDTIKEIIDDNGNGIIDAWTNEIFNTAVVSGHSYTTAIEAIAGSINYVYFPYKPAYKSVNDVCDIVQAIKGAAAGPHWIVDTADRFLLTTIGAHSAAGDNPAQYWPTWFQTTEAASSLYEGVDFEQFRFQDLAKNANYVLYHGRFKRPTDGDYWTENQNALWGTTDAKADDAVNYKVGAHSQKGTYTAPGGGVGLYYPSTVDLAWDFAKIGGKHNVPTINFWAMRDADCGNCEIYLSTYSAVPLLEHRYIYSLQSSMALAANWYFFALPIGPYAFPSVAEGFTGWMPDGVLGGDWSDIDTVWFSGGIAVNDQEFWVDGLNVQGWVLRGARQAAAYSATDKMKTVVITDEVAKDDTLTSGTPGTTDIGLMGRLCKAEYLRRSTTPRVGTFTTPIAPSLLPGQKTHVYAKKKTDDTYSIDQVFRVLYFTHDFSSLGAVTHWAVTSDLLNANPRPLPTQLNVLLSAVRPEFQDRQASSIKTRDIDVTQPILEESY